MVLKQSAFLSCIKGTAGGSFVSSNVSGLYLSNKVPAVLNRSLATVNRSNRFRVVAELWKQLTDAERTDWNRYAKSSGIWFYNKCGEAFTPTGYQAFLQRNLMVFDYSFPMRTPPGPGLLMGMSITSFTASSLPTLILTFDVPRISKTSVLNLFFTSLMSPGVYSPSVKSFRFLRAIDSASYTETVDLSASYTSKFGPIIPDSAIFVRVLQVDSTVGIHSVVGQSRAYVSS